jgi:hypothetical protein
MLVIVGLAIALARYREVAAAGETTSTGRNKTSDARHYN